MSFRPLTNARSVTKRPGLKRWFGFVSYLEIVMDEFLQNSVKAALLRPTDLHLVHPLAVNQAKSAFTLCLLT